VDDVVGVAGGLLGEPPGAEDAGGGAALDDLGDERAVVFPGKERLVLLEGVQDARVAEDRVPADLDVLLLEPEGVQGVAERDRARGALEPDFRHASPRGRLREPGRG